MIFGYIVAILEPELEQVTHNNYMAGTTLPGTQQLDEPFFSIGQTSLEHQGIALGEIEPVQIRHQLDFNAGTGLSVLAVDLAGNPAAVLPFFNQLYVPAK